MDELKKYLQNHADNLHQDEPGPQVWENILRETESPKKPATLLVFTRWAAAACILVLAGIGTWHIISDRKDAQKSLQAKAEKNITTPAQKEPVTETPDLSAIAKVEEPINANKAKDQKPKTKDLLPINSKESLEALSNIESSFTQVINLQRARVSTTPMYAETPEYFNDFKIQIKQIEKDEKVIKSDIAKRGMTDELLDQLINLYEQKLNTLKQLQIEMNKTNNRYKQNRGPVDSTRTYFLNI
jgi:hypothetical protein